MFKITMDGRQVNAMAKWLGRFDEAAREPSTMSAGVKNIGIGMQSQFKSEGGHYGFRWQNLAQATKMLREQRGYPADHPILVQSGSLKASTADALRSYNTGTTAMVRAADGISMIASSQPLLFTAKAGGAKMQNHFGGKVKLPNGGEGHLPPRPFFGFGDFEAEMAFEAIFRRLMSQWRSYSSLVTRIK